MEAADNSDSGDSSMATDSSLDSDEEDQDDEADDEPVAEVEDEDDEIVQAFRRARDVQRNHPPDIDCPDEVTNISFHPNNHMIAAASMLGDVYL